MSAVRSDQTDLDAANAAFWDELCGTGLARQLRIDVIDDESLRRFDDAYMAKYPYLWRYLELARSVVSESSRLGLASGRWASFLPAPGPSTTGWTLLSDPLR
jgi:hypothetical protein